MLNPMPSGAKLNYLCKGSNFTIQNWSRKSLENLSKQRCQHVMSQYKTHTCCFVCDPPYEKTRILRFKGVFDRKSLNNKEPATCLRNKVHNMAVSYVTHSTKRVKK